MTNEDRSPGPDGGPLARFSPLTRTWFGEAFAEPTPALAGAWEAIASGRHTLVVGGQQDPRRPGHHQRSSCPLWVYGRSGEPCRRCGTTVERIVQGGEERVAYLCSSCQPRAG
jgi:hypothetical protein